MKKKDSRTSHVKLTWQSVLEELARQKEDHLRSQSDKTAVILGD